MSGELTPLEKSLMGQVARLEFELATIGMFGGTCCISASGALLDKE